MQYVLFNLVNTDTGDIMKAEVELSPWECDTLNYAYSLNSSPKKYIPVPGYVDADAEELELFKFVQPI